MVTNPCPGSQYLRDSAHDSAAVAKIQLSQNRTSDLQQQLCHRAVIGL
ncbi:hypothetical protein HX92_3657 [Mycobacterium tuberculosis]|nr:hypothetical protein BTB1458_2725 [Mycobacterium tuberculosis]EQM20552.1 hypothetical protein FJ05194_2113 [Mycobacterium tuberculosis FJ05194]BAL66486.1 hypothetical protein ERDMAN_2697 [Mycobacterium tuberculosis str. Erdman = ATCC 35801]BAQ06557.1 hypothetical protein KURONO_2765 [Mycobacterium tuberculosis str. Kurono]KDA14575.1 hypothetical protein CO60_2173 [Mycobacterium tuberculosis]